MKKVTSIITFDWRANYSDIPQNSTCKVLKKRKCTYSSRDCFCSSFYFTNQLLNVSLKRKTNNILHHHTAYDYRKGTRSRLYTTAMCCLSTSKTFSWECLQIPVSWWQLSQFTTNQTEHIIFRSPGISEVSIHRSVAHTDGQRNRYVLPQHTNGSCFLCCSNTL